MVTAHELGRTVLLLPSILDLTFSLFPILNLLVPPIVIAKHIEHHNQLNALICVQKEQDRSICAKKEESNASLVL